MIFGRQTNDYLICVATGKVIEFNSDRLRQLRDEICQEHGYEAVSHQFHIFGMSPEGRAALASESTAVKVAAGLNSVDAEPLPFSTMP